MASVLRKHIYILLNNVTLRVTSVQSEVSFHFNFFLFTEYPYSIQKKGGEFCLQDYGFFIKPRNGSVLLLDSRYVKQGTLANGGFSQIGVALLTKASILNSFQRTTKELNEIRTSKDKRNKHLYDKILENSKFKKVKK